MNNEISIIIKTFERKKSLMRLLESIKKLKLEYKIYILDDSKKNYRSEILDKYSEYIEKYIVTDFDIGLSKGRNILLENIDTKYFVLCDDDFIFNKKTDLNKMKNLLEEYKIDILGGVLYDFFYERFSIFHFIHKLLFYKIPLLCLFGPNTEYNFAGDFTIKNKICFLNKTEYFPPMTKVDFVLNFFIAETKKIRNTVKGWNPVLKIGEHEDFFLRAKDAGLNIGTTYEVGVLHARDFGNKKYYMKRDRVEEFRAKELEKLGIIEVKNIDASINKSIKINILNKSYN